MAVFKVYHFMYLNIAIGVSIVVCSGFLKIIVSLSLVFLENLVNNSTSKYAEKLRMYKMRIGISAKNFHNLLVMKIFIISKLKDVIIQIKNSY